MFRAWAEGVGTVLVKVKPPGPDHGRREPWAALP